MINKIPLCLLAGEVRRGRILVNTTSYMLLEVPAFDYCTEPKEAIKLFVI